MQKIIVKFGLIAGLLTTAFMVITMVILPPVAESSWGAYVGYASMIIAFSTIFIGIRSYRDHHEAGQVTFVRGLLIGLGITSIATIFYVVGWMVYYPLGGEAIMDEYFRTSIENIKQSELGEEEMQAKLAKMQRFEQDYQLPLVRILYSIFEIFPVGLLISIISALLLKKK